MKHISLKCRTSSDIFEDSNRVVAVVDREGRQLWICCESKIDVDKFIERKLQEVMH